MAMLAPRSYTSEDVIELHCHGGGVCAQRVLQATIEAGARPARQGEFTLRAFLNGRLDLSQAESVLQLLQVGVHCMKLHQAMCIRDVLHAALRLGWPGIAWYASSICTSQLHPAA